MALSTLREKQTSEEKSFLWKIPHFLAMRNLEEVVNAQEITFEMGGGIGMPTKWNCYLRKMENGDIELHVNLLDYPKHVTAVYAHYQIRRKHTNFKYPCELDCICCSKWNFDKNMIDGAEPVKIIRYDRSADTDKGTLHLILTITLFNLENPQLTTLLAEYQEKFVDQHHKILASIRGNPPEINNDLVTVVSKDGDEFAGDAIMLAKRSPVFLSMFQGNMIEAETGVVKVDDIGGASLEVLLEFCNTGTLKENWKEVGVIEGLLYGAHKYMLEHLLEFLGKALPLVCTPDNCGKLMSLARAFEMKETQLKLFEYFKQNLAGNLEEVASFMEDATRVPAN